MLNETTLTKLRDLKLKAMVDGFDEQLSTSKFEQMTFEERFGLLVDAEWTRRQNNRMDRLIKNATFSVRSACVEDIEYHADRKLDRKLITKLGTCEYIHAHHNIIILGATGSGKTYLGNALGVAASRKRLTVKYARLPDLMSEMAVAYGEGKYHQTLRQYTRVRLLVLDEWLLLPLRGDESRFLFDLVDARYNTGSTIFCSQFEPNGWHGKIGEPALADAVCDRIVNNAYTIVVGSKDSESMRKRKGLKEAEA
ncbi:transposase [Clostridia bacterium]|nr:transposase [Clostridia bacterium]